jgi:pimeloyl-ACP methyl ester carboxylesterase
VEGWAKSPAPTLVILGGQDEHTPVSEMEELTRRIPNARLSVYPEAGHGVHDARSAREACTQEARELMRLLRYTSHRHKLHFFKGLKPQGEQRI